MSDAFDREAEAAKLHRSLVASIRNAALDEAAKVAEEHQRHVPRRDIIANGYIGNVVSAILALKDTPASQVEG